MAAYFCIANIKFKSMFPVLVKYYQHAKVASVHKLYYNILKNASRLKPFNV